MWKSHLNYHPRLGYTYAPNFLGRIPRKNGGFLLRTNAAGFRSDRDFIAAPNGQYRVLLFGDSQTAGLGVGNPQRFSDRLEALVPDLEIYNFAVDGTGTDQQYLTYLEHRQIAHDLIVIGLFVDDVARVGSSHLRFQDADGREVFYPKPYYRAESGNLLLQGLPVPKRPCTRGSLPASAAQATSLNAFMMKMRQAPAVRKLADRLRLTSLVQQMRARSGPTGYSSVNSPGWRLLSLILRTWIAESSVPVLLLPIPLWTFLDSSAEPGGYRLRLRELAIDTGCLLHDLLPDLRGYPPTERASFHFPSDTHLSAAGHAAIAHSLAPALARLVARQRS